MILDLLYYLNFSLFAFSLPIFGAVFYRIRPEKSFLPFFMLNSTLFYIFAIFHMSVPGFWLIYAGNLLFYIPSVIKMKKLQISEMKDNIFTPGFFVLFSMLTVFFLFVRNDICGSWDSISHWMTSVKFFFDEEKLCCEYPSGILAHASYPPGMCMMSMLAHRCFWGAPFREGLVIFAHIIPIYGAMACFFCRLHYSQYKTLFFTVLVNVALVPFALRYRLYNFCYTDLCLAAVMTIVFYQILMRRDYTVTGYFLLAILNGWMFMIRNAGWGYSLAIMILFAIFLICDRKKAFYTSDGIFSRKKALFSSFVFLFPILLKLSWEILLRYYSTPLKFGGTRITIENFEFLFGTSDSPGWETLKNYLSEISISHLPVLLLILILSTIMIKRSEDPVIRNGLRLTVSFFLPASVVFLTVMFFYYVFEFQVRDSFPSLHRYFFHFIIIPILVIIFLIIEHFSTKETVVRKTDLRFNIFYWSVILLLITVFCRYSVQKKNLRYLKWRKECEQVFIYDALIRSDATFGHISTSGNGFKRFCMQLYYPYNYTKEIIEDPVLPGRKVSSERGGATPVQADGLQENFKKADYIFLIDPQEDFIQDFSSVFVEDFKPDPDNIRNRMFKVTPDGKLSPVKYPPLIKRDLCRRIT